MVAVAVLALVPRVHDIAVLNNKVAILPKVCACGSFRIHEELDGRRP